MVFTDLSDATALLDMSKRREKVAVTKDGDLQFKGRGFCEEPECKPRQQTSCMLFEPKTLTNVDIDAGRVVKWNSNLMGRLRGELQKRQKMKATVWRRNSKVPA